MTNPDQIIQDNFLSDYNYSGQVAQVAPGNAAAFQNGKYIITYEVLDTEELSSGLYEYYEFFRHGEIDPITGSYAHYIKSSSAGYNIQIAQAFTDIMQANENNDPYGVLFAHVANIDFATPTNGSEATIAFGQSKHHTDIFGGPSDTGAVANTLDSNYPNPSDEVKKTHGDIWINTEHQSSVYGGINRWDVDSNSGQSAILKGTWSYKVLLEEISHSLGVDVYNGISENSSSYLNTHQYTVTSYNPHPGMTFSAADGTGSYPTGLQLYDIYALQEIYGINWGTRTGNTVYSKMTAFSTLEANDAFVYTIWDGNGVDTIDASGYSNNGISAIIDLRQGEFSSIGRNTDGGGASNNVAIAYHAIIENAIGTDEGDVIIGNAWNNVITGGNGTDRLFGDGVTLEYDDIIKNYYDNDAGYGTGVDEHSADNPGNLPDVNDSGDDELYGGAGDDWLWGGQGNDVLDGGDDFDNIDYKRFDVTAFETSTTDPYVIDYEITILNKALGNYEVEITFDDLSVETDTIMNVERVAHAERQVNDALYQGNIQGDATLAARTGGYVSFYEARGQYGKTIAIVGRELDESGNVISGEMHVSTAGGSHQIDPSAMQLDDNGGFGVVWQQRNDVNRIKSFIKLYGPNASSDIEVFEDPNTGNTTYDNTWKTQESAQDMAVLANGNIIVVAQASGGSCCNSIDIIGQVLAPDGSKIGTKTIMNSYTASYQKAPAVAALTDGGYVVTWDSWDGSYYGIYGRVFNANGTPRTPADFQINDTTYWYQDDSDVVGLADGRFVVVWSDGSGANGHYTDIVFKIFNADGTAATGEITANQHVQGTQYLPEIAALEDGGFVITWTDNYASSDGSAASVWAQQYDLNGDPVQDNFLVNVTTSGTQNYSAVTGLDNGDFAVAWSEGYGTDIHARLYSNSAPIPQPPPAQMMMGGGTGSSTLFASQSLQSSSQSQAQFRQSDKKAEYAPDLYDARDPVFHANGDTETFTYDLADYKDQHIEIIDGLSAKENDSLSFEDLFEVSDLVMRAVSDYFDVIETGGNSHILVDRDGSRGKDDFQTVAILNDTTGIDIADMIRDGTIEI